MRRILAVTLLFVLLYCVPAGACTTFAVHDGTGNISFVGKSLDWGSQAGIVFANMQGITKQSLVMPPSADCPAGPTQGLNWTSQHASITINEYGCYFPNAGMNDQGLVVETMEMEPPSDKCGAVYDPEGAIQSINSLQMVQYILDSFDSVDAFVRSAPNFAIVPSTVYLHYMICDPSECAVAEIKGNKLVITTGRDLPGLSLPPAIEVVNDLRHLALTNDYYDCSFHGRNGNHAYALEDYAGFGGDRFIPFGPEYCLAPLLHDICVPGKPCAGVGCDQACRDKGNCWYNSNSVERFVRAAAGSQQLSLTETTPGDMFLALNNVFSHDGNTGGTMWQIVYDLKDRRIHWRTIADGYDPNAGFTGATRSVGFSDVNYGSCGTNPAMMANIDAAPPCNAENPPPFCNPNHAPPHDLPTCGETTCAMSPYDESYNRNLVAFSVQNTEVDQGMPDFRKMVQVSLPGISDDIADGIVFNIWGGYPRGYTQCGRDVEAEDKVNLFLSSVLGPYINPYLAQTLPDPETYSTGKTICTVSECKTATSAVNDLIAIINAAIDTVNHGYDVKCFITPKDCPRHISHWHACDDLAFQLESTTISGLKGASLTDLVVQKTPDTTDNLVFTVSIPDLQNPGGAVADYYCHYKDHGQDEYYKLGKLTTNGKGMFERLSATISGDVTKAMVSDDISNPLCFAGGKIENVTIENFDPVELGFSCSYVDSALGEISSVINTVLKTLGFDPKRYHTDFSNLCSSTLTTLANDLFQDSIEPAVLTAVNNAVDSKFRSCGSLTVSPPPAPPTLTAGWGGLEEQYVTARAGHTYVLEASVGADRDSGSHQFATFAEAVPGYEPTCMRQGVDGVGPGWFAPCRYVNTVRMTAREGGNGVSTLWTPETEGETILLFDVARWDEKTDEVSPAALHVYVLPSEGPTSWLGLTNEGLSTKLKEVK